MVDVGGEAAEAGWASAASDRAVDEVLEAIDPDVVVQSSAPDPLLACPAVTAWARRPSAISVAISPFGATGPWSAYRSSDATDQAISGHLYLTGDPDRPPLAGPEHQVGFAAGLNAAIGVLAALAARDRDGAGQDVEISHHEVMVALHQFTLLRYTHNGDVLRRMGNRYAGPGRPIGAYRCGDRMISLVVPRDDQLDRLLAVAGLDHLLELPGIDTTYDLMHHPTLLDDHLGPWLAAQDHDETIELLQDLRIPAGPVSTMDDVLADPQLRARDYWARTPTTTASGPDDTVVSPAPPMLFTATTAEAESSTAERGGPVGGVGAEPLAGLRVLDLTRVWAGPLATRILADLGADVTMIEAPWARGPAGIDRSSVVATHYYPDDDPGLRHWNRIGFINKYALNKRSVAMDLTDSEARSAFESMVARVDVVIENYSPRVMPQLGLDEDRLHQLNPSLVYVTMPGFGRTGPSADRVAYGPIIDSHAGLSVLQGYTDEPARKGGVAWPDPVAGLHAAFATLVALAGRRREVARGRVIGTTVEVAQLEATVATVGPALVERQLTGREPQRLGNRHPSHAPQGVYRCAGDDRWLAVTVVDDDSWRRLCDEADLDPTWAGWTVDQRHRHHDEIDRAVERFTASCDNVGLMRRLQEAGVPAAAVADAPMVMADPHLRARDFFAAVDHPEAGTHEWPTCPIRLSATPASIRLSAPTLGQHNRQVLGDLADLDEQAIDDLERRAVVTDHPPH